MTYTDVAAVQPFGNTLVTLDLTGRPAQSVLEEQWQPDGSSRPKLHLGISEGSSTATTRRQRAASPSLECARGGEPSWTATMCAW